MQLNIIDISSWQHPNSDPIDWHAVASDGVHGVIIKATQGTWYVNPDFADDAHGAHDAGLMVGAYHFAEPGRSEPDAQAAHFHEAVGGLSLELGVWLDVERTDGLMMHDLQAWAEGFLNAVDTPQVPAGIYMNVDYANQLAQMAQTRRLWLANPSGIATSFQPVIVQTGQGEVAGIVGAVDKDVILNSRSMNPPGGGGQPMPLPPPPDEPPPTTADTPTEGEGGHGPAVERIQTLLNAHGATLKVDGSFGPLTKEAVVAFQEANHLAADGIVGPRTWPVLGNQAAAHLTTVDGPEGTVQEGNGGPAVTLLQRLLNETGATLTVDGAFGPNTRSAVVGFQLAHDLSPDGVVGPLTWAALKAAT